MHVLLDAEELRLAFNENYVEDGEKLMLRLSIRKEKKRRKGKVLTFRQLNLLAAFPSRVVPLKKGEPKMGFDLILTLQEVLEMMMS